MTLGDTLSGWRKIMGSAGISTDGGNSQSFLARVVHFSKKNKCIVKHHKSDAVL